jgi:hypothetical protein
MGAKEAAMPRRAAPLLALALLCLGPASGRAATCEEQWGMAEGSARIFDTTGVVNPRFLSVPLPTGASGDAHLTFTGTALSPGGVNPTDDLHRVIERVNLSAVHGVRFDGHPLKLHLGFGPRGPGLLDYTATGSPATFTGDGEFLVGVDAVDAWFANGDLMLDFCVAIGGTSAGIFRLAYQVEVLADAPGALLGKLIMRVPDLISGRTSKLKIDLDEETDEDQKLALRTSHPDLVILPDTVVVPRGARGIEVEVQAGRAERRTPVQIIAISGDQAMATDLVILPAEGAPKP